MVKKRKDHKIKHLPKSEELQHKPFWATIAIIFLVSIITIITVQESSLTGKAIQSIAYMPAGTELFSEIRDVKGVQSSTVELKETVKGGTIIFKQDETIAFDGTAYSKFTVTSTDAAKFSKITLRLKVKDLTFAPTDLRLYVNGKEIATTLDKLENGYDYFTASLQFEEGQYIIGKKKVIAQPVVKEEVVVPVETPIVEEPVAPVVEQPASVVEVVAPEKTFWQKVKAFFGME